MGVVESKIQSDILGYLNGLDHTYVVNFGGSASSAKGTPDLIVCHKGRFIGLEVKRPDSDYGVTKAQEIRIKQINKAGGFGCAVTSVKEVAALLPLLDGK